VYFRDSLPKSPIGKVLQGIQVPLALVGIGAGGQEADTKDCCAHRVHHRTPPWTNLQPSPWHPFDTGQWLGTRKRSNDGEI
jgi:hypothetical protein